MATIVQTISAFPAAPDSVNDSPPVFNSKANAFVGHQSGVYVGEVNQWATEANAVRDDINNIVATLPDGSIDDINLGLDKVFSNQHLVDTNYGIESSINSGRFFLKLPDGTAIVTGSGSYTLDADGIVTINIGTTLLEAYTAVATVNQKASTSISSMSVLEIVEFSETQIIIRLVTARDLSNPNIVTTPRTISWTITGRWK